MQWKEISMPKAPFIDYRLDVYQEEFPLGELTIDDARAYADQLNGICLWIKDNGWKKGHRNNLSVNIAICMHALGIDKESISPFTKPEDETFASWLMEVEDKSAAEDWLSRFQTISYYLENWDHDLTRYGFDVYVYDKLYKDVKAFQGEKEADLFIKVR